MSVRNTSRGALVVAIDGVTPGTNPAGTVTAPFPVAEPTGGLIMGQYKITAAAVAISTTKPTLNGVTVKARAENVGSVWLGASAAVTTTDDGTGVGFRLEPGATCSIPCSDVDQIFAIGTANDVLYYEGN